MTAALTTAAGALARELACGVSARELAAVLDILYAGLVYNVDARVTNKLWDLSAELDGLQDELDDEACTCPWETVRPDMVSPPERLIGRNRDCPVHGCALIKDALDSVPTTFRGPEWNTAVAHFEALRQKEVL